MSPKYFYHIVPPEMQGHTLYPLNQLKTLYPDLYTQQMAKYQDHPSRKKLPERIIPKLNCLWNDVVQCAPIHPHHLYSALKARQIAVQPDMRFFQIPLETLPDVPIAICQTPGAPDQPLPESAVTLLDRATYQELTEVPQKTLDWYDQLAATRRRGAWFVGVPHVMVLGTIDIREVSIIEWA